MSLTPLTLQPARFPKWFILGAVFVAAMMLSLLTSGWWGGAAHSAGGNASLKQSAPATATITSGKFGVTTAGTTQSYSHVVVNNGLQPETFNFSVASRQGWGVSLSPAIAIVLGGQSVTVTVQLTIPNNTPLGTMALTTLTGTNTTPAPPIFLIVHDTLLVNGNTPLKVPPLQPGVLVSNQRVYSLTEIISSTEFFSGTKTPTYGYNGSFLGPTLVMTKGEVVSISVTNNLTAPTSTHWHGLHLPGQTDGGPHQAFNPGETWRTTFTIVNEASTVWYHPHPHGHAAPGETVTVSTGIQVYMGLAGMILIRDAASAALGLPQTYGVDEFPIVVQDRNFNPDGSLSEFPATQDHDLRKGNFFMINGTLAGNLNVPAQMVRFHVLNGSNPRFYQFGFSDNRNFYQIASDNALLNQPVQRNRLVLAPGERAEIVVDLSGLEGQTLRFMHYGEELRDTYTPNHIADDYDRSNLVLFSLNITGPTAGAVTTLPSTLNNITRLTRDQAVFTRTLILNIPPGIDFKMFQMERIDITTSLGVREVWSIVNSSDESHPIHIHDSPFQIIARNGAPPPDYELGWKDTVIVRPGETVDVMKEFIGFADPNGPFMYHCHILEHEDKGMMGQYVIIDFPKIYLPLILR